MMSPQSEIQYLIKEYEIQFNTVASNILDSQFLCKNKFNSQTAEIDILILV